MADTSTTTKVSELAVPLFTAMLSNGDDPSQLITGGDMLSKADSYGISLGSDRLFWENLRAVPLLKICSKQPSLIQQCIRTADNFCSIFDINWLAGAYYELVGRDNSGDDPSDFRIDGTGFSLKVGSPILWNTTPKSLLPYTDAVLFEKLENEALSYLQGVPLRSKSGEYKKNQPAYDWYLYADHDLCQRTYTNFLHSVFMLMYELRAGGVLQSEWNPHCGEGEWWARDCDGIPYPLTDNTDILGQTKIPLNNERIIYQEALENKRHYLISFYDGFDELGYPASFVGLTNGRGAEAIIPIGVYEYDDSTSEMFSLPAFNGSGTVPITIEDVLNRNDYSEDEEFIPLYCFTINGYDSNGNVIRKPMLQDHAKIIGKFARTSALSPMTGFSDNRVWSTLPHPVEEYESYYSSLSGKQMTEIEYWYSRLDMNASDAVAFALEDQLDDIGGEKELLVSLLRIIDCEYYYVNIGTDKTDIFMVPSLEQFYGNAVAIQDMDFDADTKGTVVRLSCGVDDILVINIIFRNTNTWFNGAPSMEVRYDKNSSLDAVYHRVY